MHTIIPVLVLIGLLALLAAVIAPNVSYYLGSSDAERGENDES